MTKEQYEKTLKARKEQEIYSNLQEMVNKGLGYWNEDGEFCRLINNHFPVPNEQRIGDEPV